MRAQRRFGHFLRRSSANSLPRPRRPDRDLGSWASAGCLPADRISIAALPRCFAQRGIFLRRQPREATGALLEQGMMLLVRHHETGREPSDYVSQLYGEVLRNTQGLAVVNRVFLS